MKRHVYGLLCLFFISHYISAYYDFIPRGFIGTHNNGVNNLNPIKKEKDKVHVNVHIRQHEMPLYGVLNYTLRNHTHTTDTVSTCHMNQAFIEESLMPLSVEDVTCLSRKKISEWREIILNAPIELAMHAYKLCAISDYRTALQALPVKEYKHHMVAIFNKLQNIDFDDKMEALGYGIRDFYYKEGMQAYTEQERVHAQQAFAQKEIPKKLTQCQESLVDLKQKHDGTKELVSLYKKQETTPLQKLDTQLKCRNNQELYDLMQRSYNALHNDAHKIQQGLISTVDHYTNAFKNNRRDIRIKSAEVLGVTRRDFLCTGNNLQHAIHENILLHAISRISEVALSTTMSSENKHVVEKFLEQAVVSMQKALECNKKGDIAGIYQYVSQMHDITRYATLIEKGLLDYKESYNSQTLQSFSKTADEYKEQCIKNANPAFVTSKCLQVCGAHCQERERHCILRQNNEAARRCDEFSRACTSVAQGNIVIATKNYNVSPELATVIKEGDIPLCALQQCTGTKVDHILHGQAVDFMHAALKTVEDFKRPLIQASYDAIKAVQHGDIKQAYYYLRLCGTMADMAAISKHIPTHVFAPVQSMTEVALYKALNMVKSISNVGMGAVKGVGEWAYEKSQLLINPRELAKEVVAGVQGIGTLATQAKNVIKDQLLMAAPATFASEIRINAEKRQLARYEKAVALMEYGLETAASMTAEEWGNLSGRMMADVATGKTVPAMVSTMAQASKNLVRHIKKSELIASTGNKLSLRAQQVRQKAKGLEATVKKIVGVEKPHVAVVGVPGKVGVEFMEAEQAGIKAGQKIGGAGSQAAKDATKIKVVEQVGMTVAEALKDIRAACAQLDPSVGNIAKLEEAVTKLKDIPGAVGKDGPITKLFECGLHLDKLGTARGAAYEIEKAYDVIKKGDRVISFGNKHAWIKNGQVIRKFEIDIETPTRFIECKNWEWSKINKLGIEELKRKLPDRQRMAISNGKIFELHSKYALPADLKLWLQSNGIKFFEG